MNRGAWIALLAALAFATIFVARLPAAWFITPSGTKGSCTEVTGTVWEGECAGFVSGRIALDELHWDVHPARILLGQLAATLSATRGAGTVRADVGLGLGGRMTASNVLADFPLDRSLAAVLPASLTGRAHIDAKRAVIERGAITSLEGRLEVHDLTDHSEHTTPLGSYVITFPGGEGEPTGKIRDLSGPLAVEGTLRFTHSPPGYDLSGLVGIRAGAPPELVNAIRFLGSPDSTGRRPFALTGTF